MKNTMNYNDPMQSGRDAFKSGVSRDDCPADRRTHANAVCEWVQGWDQESKKCKGENCESYGETPHSKECLFEHFMSYSGGYNEDEATQEKLKKAYFDGFEAVQPECATPVFSAMGLTEVNLPKLII